MVQYRKEQLANNNVYHIYTRSIARFIVFNGYDEFQRMIDLCQLYRHMNFNYKYSQYKNLSEETQLRILNSLDDSDLLVKIISYCLMPTHVHLVLEQMSENGISKFLSRILNGYSRFFNTKHNRVGPLWSGRFKSVLVSKDDQLVHLTRYIHLNPSSAGLVKDPKDWGFSSYHEYVTSDNDENKICDFREFIDLTPRQYKKFVLDQKAHQRGLSIIKSLLLDGYAG